MAKHYYKAFLIYPNRIEERYWHCTTDTAATLNCDFLIPLGRKPRNVEIREDYYMTKEELLQEFLEASKLDKNDVDYYKRFTKIDYNGKILEVIGLVVKLKGASDEITYFHHPN